MLLNKLGRYCDASEVHSEGIIIYNYCNILIYGINSDLATFADKKE